jgi:putative GTP pyrophosphokinase
MPISKTQIDRLGERLKQGQHTESDLRLLDDYRRSFGKACEAVARTLQDLGQSPTARPAKTIPSIVEKLRRESVRLSQMQDVAGCRIVVNDIVQQDQFVESLKTAFPAAILVDRRENPSYGYRAVHVIAQITEKAVEVQVRSSLQHLWAEVSEKSSDVLDPAIKYGGGNRNWRVFLDKSSAAVASFEKFERLHHDAVGSTDVVRAAHETYKQTVADLFECRPRDHVTQELQEKLKESTRNVEDLERRSEESRAELARLRRVNTNLLIGALSRLNDLKRQE